MKRIFSLDEIPSDVLEKSAAWQAKRHGYDPAAHAATLYAILHAVQATPEVEWQDRNSLQRILLRHPKDGAGLFS